MTRYWTPEYDEQLLVLINFVSAEVLANQWNTDVAEIEERLSYLLKTRSSPPDQDDYQPRSNDKGRSRQPWTAEEEALIIALDRPSDRELSYQLRRTTNSIRVWRTVLKRRGLH